MFNRGVFTSEFWFCFGTAVVGLAVTVAGFFSPVWTGPVAIVTGSLQMGWAAAHYAKSRAATKSGIVVTSTLAPHQRVT